MASSDSAQRKRELLRRRLAAQGLAGGSAAGEESARPRREPGRGYPASRGQRRMWFLQRLRPGSAAYTISTAFELTGPLDLDALHGAVRAVARRHEILRTTYRVRADGQLEQVPRDDVEPAWHSVDLSAEPAARHADRTHKIAIEAARRPFDLAVESPLRVTVVRHAPDRHVLALAAHHIAWDDACWDVFFGDLLAHYDHRVGDHRVGDHRDASVGDGAVERPAPAPQFLDAALATPTAPAAADLAFWHRTLSPLAAA
ncbi:condensation domain-containing protein, partial [Frankia sp. AgKG'84/4]|uniref:condensation domain-containing protein n=1 Tax=Frankia sp. AgKG'84/4 TaxID=573490 RepID=UPI002029EB98